MSEFEKKFASKLNIHYAKFYALVVSDSFVTVFSASLLKYLNRNCTVNKPSKTNEHLCCIFVS